MAEGSEYSLSRRDAILQWMHNVQKATSSDKTEKSDRGLTFNPDTTCTHGSYQTITSPLHHSSSNTTSTALPTPPTHTHQHPHHPHSSHTHIQDSSSSRFHNPLSNVPPAVMEPPIANISRDRQLLQQYTMTNVSPEWRQQLPTSSGIEPQVSMEVSVSPPDITTPSVLLQQPKSTSPLPDPIQDIQLPSFDPLRTGSFDLSSYNPRRPKPLIRRYDTFTGLRSNFGRHGSGSHSHITRQLTGSHSNVNQQSSNSMKTSLSASHLEHLMPKSAPVSPNLARKSNATSDEVLPPPMHSSLKEGHHLGLPSCSSRKSYSQSDIRQLDIAMDQQYVASPSPNSSLSSLAPNVGGDSVPSENSSLDGAGDDGRLKFEFGSDSGSQDHVEEELVQSTMVHESVLQDYHTFAAESQKIETGNFDSHTEGVQPSVVSTVHGSKEMTALVGEHQQASAVYTHQDGEAQKIQTGYLDQVEAKGEHQAYITSGDSEKPVSFGGPISSRETGMNVGQQTGLTGVSLGQEADLTGLNYESKLEATCVLMELDSCQETGLTSSSPPQETDLTSMSSSQTGQAGNSNAEEELLEILKKWHREGKGHTEDLLYAMRLTGHRESADRLQLKEDLASFRAEKHSDALPLDDQCTSPLPTDTLSHSTPFIRQRQLTQSPPSSATPLSPQATPTSTQTTSTKLFRQRSGSLGVESESVISRKRLANFDRSQMFSFDTSNEECFVQPQHQPRFLKRSPPSSPGHPPPLLVSPPSHYPHPHTDTLHHSHRRSSSDIITTNTSPAPSKSHGTHPLTKLGHTLQINFPQSNKYMYLPRRSSSPLGHSTSTTTTTLQGTQTLDKAPLTHKPSPVGPTSTPLHSLPETHPLNVSRNPAPLVSSAATAGSIVALIEQMKLESGVGSSRKRLPSAISGTSTSLSFPPARKRAVNRQDSGIGTLSEPSVKY